MTVISLILGRPLATPVPDPVSAREVPA